jgi:hypothetical protein
MSCPYATSLLQLFNLDVTLFSERHTILGSR